LFFIVFSLFVQITVVGSTTLDFTFEKDILYDVDNPDYDDFFNLRNSTSITGNYNATYSFDGEVGLEHLDISFVDDEVGVDDLIVISSYLEHKDVILMGDSGTAYFYHYFDEQIEGSIEFWIDLYNGTAIQFYLFDDVNNAMLSRIYADTARNYKGDGIGGTEYENHAISEGMTHFKVVWDCTSDSFDLFINGYHLFDGVNFMGDSDLTHIDEFKLQVHTPDSYCVLDAYGEYWDEYYNIGDNIVPLIETNESIQEVDRFEFTYEAINDYSDNGDDNPSSWTDIENGYDHTNIYVSGNDRYIKIEGVGTTHENTGLEKDYNHDFDFFNVSWLFKYNYMTNPTSDLTMNVYSKDDTIIASIIVASNGSVGNENIGLYYYDGSGRVFLASGFLAQWNEFNLFIDNGSKTCFLRRYQNNVYLDDYFFPLIVNNKEGLGNIEFVSHTISSGYSNLIYLDWIGVYINEKSLSTEFGYLISPYIAVNHGYEWDLKNQNFFNIKALGNISINGIATAYYPEISNLVNIIDMDFNGTNEFVNTYEKTLLGDSLIPLALLFVVVHNAFQILNISIEGVKLSEGSNDYYLDFTYSNIEINESYFWVDSSNRLQYNLIIDDNDTEYIQANFNIIDVSSENRSVSFLSNIDGVVEGFISVDYLSGSESLIEFPYYLRQSSLILPQTETIKSFTILITDNDLSYNTVGRGFISNIKLIYNPSISITITTLNLLSIIVPLIVMIAPPLALNKKFGSGVILPMFLLMSLMCVLTGLIPVWLFFIIAFSSIGFLMLKKKVEGET
jgi:hypothetical protein